MVIFCVYNKTKYYICQNNVLGYVNLLVSTNISLPLHAVHERMKLEDLHQLFSHLRRSSYNAADANLLRIISQHLSVNYDVIVSRASWLPHGISFHIRALNVETYNNFVNHYGESILLRNATNLSLIDEVAHKLNISHGGITVDIPPESMFEYRNTYLPIQG